MKRIILLTLLLISISATAQVTGGFFSGDPNAWFDKEIFFYAKNNLRNNYGYGVDLPNVTIIVNNEYKFETDVWPYGAEVVFDKSDGVKFDKGSTIVVYVNGQYFDQWTCSTGNPSAWDVAKRAWKAKPKGKPMNIGKVMKALRKIKL